tara:strand:- start:43 stop:321 length:279 start_codon:yes stop_codon:yes gene_type:complete
MKIELMGHQIEEALYDYVKRRLGIQAELDQREFACLEYGDTEIEYQKHKNGKLKKNKDGFAIEKSRKYVTKYANIDDSASIHLYLEELEATE